MNPTDQSYPIQPEHINASRHMFDSFNHYETEVSAGYVVRMCQERGEGWAPFSREQIEAHYQKAGHKGGFRFNRLISSGWIKEKDGLFHITHGFVSRCFNSNPAKKVAHA